VSQQRHGQRSHEVRAIWPSTIRERFKQVTSADNGTRSLLCGCQVRAHEFTLSVTSMHSVTPFTRHHRSQTYCASAAYPLSPTSV
jgi:hypothetical protein